jgi:hypothetical protein
LNPSTTAHSFLAALEFRRVLLVTTHAVTGERRQLRARQERIGQLLGLRRAAPLEDGEHALRALLVPILDGIAEYLLRGIHQRWLIRQDSLQIEWKRQHVLPHVHVGKHAFHKVSLTVHH